MLKDNYYVYANKNPFPDLPTLAGGDFSKCIQSVYDGAYTDGAATKAWLVPETGTTYFKDYAVGPPVVGNVMNGGLTAD